MDKVIEDAKRDDMNPKTIEKLHFLDFVMDELIRLEKLLKT